MITEKNVKARIVLADDHAVLRNGMRYLIEAEPDMEVVGEAEDGSRIQALVEEIRPDIAIIDLSMPEMNGVEALRRLKASNSLCKVMILTVHEDRSYLREALEAGAAGYMLKRAAADELVHAIRIVRKGGVYVDSRLVDKLLNALALGRPLSGAVSDQLSEREEQVLRAVAEGYSNKEIAATLDISVKTVETYKARSMEKLGLRSRVDIIRAARGQGWLRALENE